MTSVSESDKSIFETDKKIKNPFISGSSVLLAEAEPMKREYYSSMLRAANTSVLHVETVQQWFEFTGHGESPGYVLVDADIFKNVGDKIIQEIKSLRASLPWILRIRENNPKHEELIRLVQPNNVITEPVDCEKFYKGIEKLAGKSIK